MAKNSENSTLFLQDIGKWVASEENNLGKLLDIWGPKKLQIPILFGATLYTDVRSEIRGLIEKKTSRGNLSIISTVICPVRATYNEPMIN